MRTNPTPLAVLALFAIAAALTAALAGKDSLAPVARPAPTGGKGQERAAMPERKASRDPVLDVARRYALAARNWTPSTYSASWEAQIRLAGDRYRRELLSTRPDPAQLRALERDRAASTARVVRAQRAAAVHPHTARVFLALDETTIAGSQTVHGPTLNEVRLVSHGGRWRVTGWTVVPGGQAK